MADTRIWQLVDIERRTLADQPAQLPAKSWDAPSLCTGWRVRDVAAHLAFAASAGFGTVVVELIRAPGGLDRMIRDSAIRVADVPPGQLVASAREHRLPAAPGRHERGRPAARHRDPRPGHRPGPGPGPAGADGRRRRALERVWERNYPFYARRRLAGLRLVATDADWAGGEGALVQGPVAALMMLAAGRHATVPQLRGAGAARLGAS
ncbi:maleylpyruvate isomerase N-terminal domain-containing protein [Amycolatopsis sp. FDAARGOS 1241]|uniref:maleylpyruvate isomerase N-terminal domain-containing protein n=1 Tax=Amycolatopsis sp. FDAARGOS 1241 TaxID=2778070 RepID=UPI00194FDCF3|nr:maleylpyruvate isomerase N-terminal domain-containing protein [Amycolatopsis sp. FDAARGOS 1241]QRP48799.1 maleylpyruvate isomerase N-terminal domain-containing protein [Amycolatopsis sp. FDAARGOS 1241]